MTGFSLYSDMRPLRALVARLVAVVMLVQVLIPIQAHTRLTQDENGQVVILCTLEGERAITVDGLGPVFGEQTAGSDSNLNAAIKFSLLMADATAHDSGPAISFLQSGRTPVLRKTIEQLFLLSFTAFPIRAPPVA